MTTRARRQWRGELAVLVALAVSTTVLFHASGLDLRVSGWFYRPGAAGGAWPSAGTPAGRVLHQLSPWLAAAIGAAGLAMLAAGWRRPGRRALTAHGLLVVLGLTLGPGLVVNAIFKDHWRRPRPRQTETLGGDHRYVPPLAVGPYGKSFPCGHSSVGFAGAAFYYALRRRRAVMARVCLAGAFVIGLVTGAARVGAGAHFLSDVLWSGFLVWGTLLILYYVVLRIPAVEAAEEAGVAPAGVAAAGARPVASVTEPAGLSGARPVTDAARRRRLSLVAGWGALLILVVLLVTPFEQEVNGVWAPAADSAGAPPGGAWRIDLSAAIGHVRVILEPGARLEGPGPATGAVMDLRGAYDGFGFPGGSVEGSIAAGDAGRGLRASVRSRGWFSDLEGRVDVRIAAAAAASISIEVTDGILTLQAGPRVEALPPIHCRIRPDALRLRGVPRERVRVEAVGAGRVSGDRGERPDRRSGM